ncbi:hypothetical protein [Natrinema salifodinae]|uniref:Uncharacterized protein n=1 Tax=Natrinema salifodinae TaxID=1202768 RepID=A0A1I0M4X3_9EURY|nr:hypothetical protein [Natrinema salifodinae]SEV83332.1 hypothetical protein SAMN05216285_0477 [Natrinema salifodinae]
MSDLIPVVYYGGLVVLYFFWIYGIVSFGLDLKNKVVPGIKRYRRGRKRLDEKQTEEDERATKERQLY